MKNMNFTYYVGMLFCVLFLATKTTANDIDLCIYQAPTSPDTINEIPRQLSGVTYRDSTETLFMVTNEGENEGDPPVVYETEKDGTVRRTIILDGFNDTEGIVHIGGTRFAVSEERRGRITFFDIPASTPNIITIDYSDAKIAALSPTLGPWGANNGLEGVSYNPAMNTIYTVKEKASTKYYDFPNPVSFPVTITNASEFCTNASLNFLDIAGVHHLGLNFEGSVEVLLLSEENKTLKHVDGNCNVIGEFSLSFMNQPEGVTMDNEGNIYIVGEDNELAILTPSLDADGDGVCDANDICPDFDDNLIGTACNEDVCMVGQTYDTDCNCTGGTFQDSDGDGVCDANDVCPDFDDNLIGTACNEDVCMAGQTYDIDCNCTGGTFQDSDGDGVCDANDVCPDFDDNLIGTACNEDVCMAGQTYDIDCNCTGGTFQDSDGDGVCDANDVCPDFDDNLIGTPCDDGDMSTSDDLVTINCTCVGTPIPTTTCRQRDSLALIAVVAIAPSSFINSLTTLSPYKP